MAYEGVIKKSRTLDMVFLSELVNVAAVAFLAYSPEQLGITVATYLGLRVLIGGMQVYLRFKTTGPVGEK